MYALLYLPFPYAFLHALHPDDPFVMQYRDLVLKLLPDIRTLVNLRQQLVTGGKAERWKDAGEFMTPEERIEDAGKVYN